MKIVPYTAVFGNRDPIRNDILCFTEKDCNKFNTPRMNARMLKVLSHQWVDCDISIWMDANIFPFVSIEKIVSLLGDADVAMSHHWTAKDLLQEFDLIKIYRKDNLTNVDEQIKHYLSKGAKPEGMWWSGLIIRRHNKVVEDFNLKWWAEICRWSERDQIALPYIISKCSDLKLNTLSFNTMKETVNMVYH